MPPDRLITTPAQDVAAGVLAVLAGADHTAIATNLDLEVADLADAVHAYQAAGLAALERRAEQEWYEARVQFPDWHAAEPVAASRLAPRLQQLQSEQAIAGWWFLRKHPCWRLRLRTPTVKAVAHALDELTAAGTLTQWWPTIYEPEVTAFGGKVGTQVVHDLFCADSQGVLDYTRHAEPALGRRELSLLLVTALLHAAGLDGFERGDVFHRVARMRPTPASTNSAGVNELAGQVRKLLAVPANRDSQLFAPDGPVAFAARWLTAFTNAGGQLGDAAARGDLDRGLRAVLAHIVIFHWNRLGLSATTQAILAHAASAALLPTS